MSDLEKKPGTEAVLHHHIPSTFIVPTPEEESRVIRKLDKRLLPLVFTLYSLAVLDRSNLGNAKIAGMQKTIDLTGDRYQLLGTIFYIVYICSQWTMVGWKAFKPHNFAAFTVLFWGFIASIQAAAFNWAGLMVCRAFLGLAEAMFGPGVPLYLSYFYPKDKVGFRHGVFLSGAALANVYGSVLAYGISQIRGSIGPWRILFLIEGLPTMVFAGFTWWFLPDSISQASFLTEREKEVALYFTSRNQKVDAGHETGVRWKEWFSAFKDPKSFLPGLMYFGCNVSFASLPLFLPTIISEMGAFTRVQSQGLSGPPYVLCFIVIITVCYVSDRTHMRGPYVALCALVAAIGFIINATTETSAPRYASTFLSVWIFGSIALLLAWIANLNGTESRRSGGYTIMYTIGQCGPVLGTEIFPPSEKPLYRKGMWISAGACLMVFTLAVILTFWLRWENAKMDRDGVPVPDPNDREDDLSDEAEDRRARARCLIDWRRSDS
ncbi:unnamed protein product [Zymoseptoria tritici ST99CH_3D7]|uniref:Major facilitator superfamily (MFS) profile domain-containing protein n=1 Tax=Zymoseptoria tritici (strain ST99CH_3D7) TaxID=1276538 RepID=A0A1X7RLM7_ZYMT9|nr:unnamed protein product [Zymoseptoria tritici ST99CH_3D7]